MRGKVRRARLPLDFAFLRGVDLFGIPIPKENSLNLLVKKFARLRVARVEPIVVDQHGLMREPFLPAVTANVTKHPLTDVILKGGARQSGLALAATLAIYGCHVTYL